MKYTIVFFVALISISSFSSFQKTTFDLKASITRGKQVYAAQCITCHMENGEGIESVYPPLAKSDYLMEDKKRAIQQVLEGAAGEMTVNGIKYNGIMTAFDLTDQETADVLNYIRNSWGNQGEAVKPEEVKSLR